MIAVTAVFNFQFSAAKQCVQWTTVVKTRSLSYHCSSTAISLQIFPVWTPGRILVTCLACGDVTAFLKKMLMATTRRNDIFIDNFFLFPLSFFTSFFLLQCIMETLERSIQQDSKGCEFWGKLKITGYFKMYFFDCWCFFLGIYKRHAFKIRRL